MSILIGLTLSFDIQAKQRSVNSLCFCRNVVKFSAIVQTMTTLATMWCQSTLSSEVLMSSVVLLCSSAMHTTYSDTSVFDAFSHSFPLFF